MSVSHILGVKGRSVITGTAKETVQSIAQKLSQHRIGAVVIVDERKPLPALFPSATLCEPWPRMGRNQWQCPSPGS